MPNLPAPSMTALAGSVIREPMFHFLLIGATIFAIQAFTARPEASGAQIRERIVVTEGRARQLAQLFTQTWQRPPTETELRGLVDAFVKEEVYYREAVRLGLDRDDTVVRRRMQQKMEFLTEPGEEVLTAGDADLKRYLEANREAYRLPVRVAFTQIFLRDGTGARARAVRLLKRLRNNPDTDSATLGDGIMLPREVALTPLDRIAADFGTEFAQALAGLPRGKWAGPVRSAYGVHLVRIASREAAVDPPLAQVRDAVERDWRQAERDAFLHDEYARLRAKYDVVLAFRPRGALTE